MSVTRGLYATARAMRWGNAAAQGKLPQRFVRVFLLKLAAKAINRMSTAALASPNSTR